MKGLTVTMLPTMCAPEKLSREQLVEQVTYLQEEIFKQGQVLHDVCCKLADMSKMAHRLDSLLGALVDSYDAGDQAAILLQIKRLSEPRTEQKAKVH